MAPQNKKKSQVMKKKITFFTGYDLLNPLNNTLMKLSFLNAWTAVFFFHPMQII